MSLPFVNEMRKRDASRILQCHKRRSKVDRSLLPVFGHPFEKKKKTVQQEMSKPFDYSKWDKIELSDDEDDVHPNIDKESWFRMKHRSRVEREENEAKDRKKIEADVRCIGRMYIFLRRLVRSSFM
jgi:Cdc37 N terminal kinase binding